MAERVQRDESRPVRGFKELEQEKSRLKKLVVVLEFGYGWSTQELFCELAYRRVSQNAGSP